LIRFRVYKKAQKEPKEEVTYVVAKKCNAQKQSVRPLDVKDRYKLIDRRRIYAASNKKEGRGKGKEKQIGSKA